MSDKDFDKDFNDGSSSTDSSNGSDTGQYQGSDLNQEFRSVQDPGGAVFFTVKPGEVADEFKSKRMEVIARRFNEKDIKGLFTDLSKTAKKNRQLTKKVLPLTTATGSREYQLQMAEFSDDVLTAGKRRRRKPRKTIKRKLQRKKRTQKRIRKVN